MDTIQDPIILVQKQRTIVFCRQCCSMILVTISSDGSWYGAHYSGFTPPNIQSTYGWVCDDCWGITHPKDKPIPSKIKIGFTP